jgi:hypothetical protein
MNVHVGSWIVPVLFTFGLLIHTTLRHERLRKKGAMTIAAAVNAGLKPDDVARAAIGSFLLWRFTGLALLAWLLWALFSHPLQCGI